MTTLFRCLYECYSHIVGQRYSRDDFPVLQKMEELYNLSGSDRQTDEFMKPLIIDDTGTIRGMETVC